MSRSVYGVCSYSYVSIFWSDTFAKKFSLMETVGAYVKLNILFI